jgi:Helix-turn-helix domain
MSVKKPATSGKRACKPSAPGPDDVPRRLVTRDEAAAMLGVKWATLWNWAQAGILKPVSLPSTARRRPQELRLRRVLYDVRDIHAFIDEMRARE